MYGGGSRRGGVDVTIRLARSPGLAIRAQEHQIFVDELRRLAAEAADARVTAIAERAAAGVTA
ncbi:hypothetical protein BKN37_03800 [Mycobacterium talmoniae]|uniref:Uncharacterized protein n=1 Tax=Mycobacterium talmoniae TaxID=1858794 RepID=A0A1S1NP16_9MYCO|nr:hypothetical protein BKN37_03800 [Mycobacterium talmoniae]TDH56777.1 hypothetical protein E2F47_05155 [Mycobacterium eburneum]